MFFSFFKDFVVVDVFFFKVFTEFVTILARFSCFVLLALRLVGS